MAIEIVKVQVPLSVHVAAHVLVYAQGHRHMTEHPLTDALKQALDGDEKGYFNAEWTLAAGWTIGNRVAAQPW